MLNYSKTNSSYVGSKGLDEGLRSYFLKIYSYMAAALLVTALSAFSVFVIPPLARALYNFTPGGYIVGITGLGHLVGFAPLAISLYFIFGFGSMTNEKAKTWFWVFSSTMGLSLSMYTFIYTGASLVRSFFICSSVFAGMSIYGYSTKRDLTSMGSFMVMGLWGIFLAGIVNIFLQSSAIHFVTSILGVVIFTGLIAWDTQKLKSYYYSVGDSVIGQKMAIMGAFQLYLDFINLFLFLLRFLGVRRSND